MNRLVPEQLTDLHRALGRAKIPRAVRAQGELQVGEGSLRTIPPAFGDAIALADAGQPRATYDIDLNVFVPVRESRRVLDALGRLFDLGPRDRIEHAIATNAQVQLRRGSLPVDLFFSALPFHDAMASRVRLVEFASRQIPILSAEDLIVCDAACNRPRDWIDIETVIALQQSRLDRHSLDHWLSAWFDPTDAPRERIADLLQRHDRRSSGSGASADSGLPRFALGKRAMTERDPAVVRPKPGSNRGLHPPAQWPHVVLPRIGRAASSSVASALRAQ